ncbi:MAG: SH3 domain-containing protein [Chloroflexi bacterium]|nr:SH3 domain-containing protein [Chloroflexota bacterium]
MKQLIVLGTCLMLLLSACLPGGGNSGQDSAAQTQAMPDMAATAIAQTAAANQSRPPQQPAAPTNTPIPPVTATALVNANCRSGPDTIFDFLATLKQGESASVVGMNDTFGDWWQVELNDGIQCWIQADSLTFTGDTNSVAFVASPPTPTPKPKPSWAGAWNTLHMYNSSDPTNLLDFNINIVQTGNTLTFSWPAFGNTYNALLTLSEDGLTATGRGQRSGGGDEIQIIFVMLETNHDQFRGQWYLISSPSFNGDWCGSRNGEDKPNPCRNG